MTATTAVQSVTLLHSPAEISAALGDRVVNAQMLVCKPQQSVLLLETACGKRWIYKAQARASMEAAVYASVRSAFLPTFVPLLAEGDRSAFLLEYIDAPPIHEVMPVAEAPVWAFDLPRRIQEMAGACPVVEVLDTKEAWAALSARVLAGLARQGEDGLIPFATPSLLGELERALAKLDGTEVINGQVGLIHSDFHSGNIFCLPGGGLKVIDWKRPRRGPLVIDTAVLLDSIEIDPWSHLPPDAVRLMSLLRLADFLAETEEEEDAQKRTWYGSILFYVVSIMAADGREARDLAHRNPAVEARLNTGKRRERMAKDSELDKTEADVEKTLRMAEDFERLTSGMQEQTEGLLREYGINGEKIHNYLATGGELTSEQRAHVQQEQERFQQELERDVLSAQEQFRKDRVMDGSQKRPRPPRRNLV